jgi:hypothetical protein
MAFDYALTWPVWLLASADSAKRDEDGTAIGLTDRPAFDVVRDGDKLRVLAFTDRDLADRYLARHGAKWVPVSFDSPERFVRWLRSLARAGITSVWFDPEPVGTVYSIASVIAALERGPT